MSALWHLVVFTPLYHPPRQILLNYISDIRYLLKLFKKQDLVIMRFFSSFISLVVLPE